MLSTCVQNLGISKDANQAELKNAYLPADGINAVRYQEAMLYNMLLIILIILLVSSLIIYDVYSHGSVASIGVSEPQQYADTRTVLLHFSEPTSISICVSKVSECLRSS